MVNPDFDPEYVFSHHAITPEKVAQFEAVHTAAKHFAQVLIENTPACADQRSALRLLREATMMANAAIALDGRLT